MRRLNLLKQILYSATIGGLKDLSASTRHLLTTVNMINSRHGWPDALELSNRDLMAAAGYKVSRYSQQIVKRFQEEAAAAGLVTCAVGANGTTVYFIEELTKADVEAAKTARLGSAAVELPAEIAAKIAASRSAKRSAIVKFPDSDAFDANCNVSNERNVSNGHSGRDNGVGEIGNDTDNSISVGNGGGTLDGGDGGDRLIRELVEMGL